MRGVRIYKWIVVMVAMFLNMATVAKADDYPGGWDFETLPIVTSDPNTDFSFAKIFQNYSYSQGSTIPSGVVLTQQLVINDKPLGIVTTDYINEGSAYKPLRFTSANKGRLTLTTGVGLSTYATEMTIPDVPAGYTITIVALSAPSDIVGKSNTVESSAGAVALANGSIIYTFHAASTGDVVLSFENFAARRPCVMRGVIVRKTATVRFVPGKREQTWDGQTGGNAKPRVNRAGTDYIISPSDFNVTWYSSDESIIKVSSNGVISAPNNLKEGTAYCIIRTEENEEYASGVDSCKITISFDNEPPSDSVLTELSHKKVPVLQSEEGCNLFMFDSKTGEYDYDGSILYVDPQSAVSDFTVDSIAKYFRFNVIGATDMGGGKYSVTMDKYGNIFTNEADTVKIAVTFLGRGLYKAAKDTIDIYVRDNKTPTTLIMEISDDEMYTGQTRKILSFNDDGSYDYAHSMLKISPASAVAGMTATTIQHYFAFTSYDSNVASINKFGTYDALMYGEVEMQAHYMGDADYKHSVAEFTVTVKPYIPAVSSDITRSFWDASAGVSKGNIKEAWPADWSNPRNDLFGEYIENVELFEWDAYTSMDRLIPFIPTENKSEDGGHSVSFTASAYVDGSGNVVDGRIKVYNNRVALMNKGARLYVNGAKERQLLVVVSEISAPNTESTSYLKHVAPVETDYYPPSYQPGLITNLYAVEDDIDGASALIDGNGNGSRVRSILIGYPVSMGAFNGGGINYGEGVDTMETKNLYSSNDADFNSTVQAYYGYATFSSAHAIDMSGQTSVKAYVATHYSTTDHLIHLRQITKIPKNTGVLLVGNAYDVYAMIMANGDDDSDFETVNRNILHPSTTDVNGETAFVVPSQGTGGKYYLGLKGSQFRKMNAGAMAVGKAYLTLTAAEYEDAVTNGALNTPSLTAKMFVIDRTSTDITNINKNITNSDDGYYTLTGIRINNPTMPGIYIHKGKKLVIR